MAVHWMLSNWAVLSAWSLKAAAAHVGKMQAQPWTSVSLPRKLSSAFPNLQVFLEGLPAFPDGISRAPGGRSYWVTLATPTTGGENSRKHSMPQRAQHAQHVRLAGSS